MKKEGIVVLVILSLLAIMAIAFEIYLWVKYGSLPPEEVPSWVHWLMLGGK